MLSFVVYTLFIGHRLLGINCAESIVYYKTTINDVSYFDCKDGECVPSNASNVDLVIWGLQQGDLTMLYNSNWQGVTMFNTRENFGIKYCEKVDVMMIVCGNTQSMIFLHKRRAYLIPCKTRIETQTPTALIKTMTRLYWDELDPYMNETEYGKHQEEGFDMQHLLVHLYDHEHVRGAPGLEHRRKLADKIERSFGGVFKLIRQGYQSGNVWAVDYQGAFYSAILGHRLGLYKFMVSLTVTKSAMDAFAVRKVHQAISNSDYTEVERLAPLYWIFPSLFTSVDEGLVHVDQLSYTIKEQPSDKANLKYRLILASYNSYSVLKIESNNGHVDTSIQYSSNIWSFRSRRYRLILLFTGGPNYGFFNYGLLKGIVVCRKSDAAKLVDVKKDFSRLVQKSKMLQLIEELGKIVDDTKVTSKIGASSFCFRNFVRNAKMYRSVVLMLAGMRVKMRLGRDFKVFVKNFWLIDGYRWKNGAGNVVLIFFKDLCLKGVAEDYTDLVSTIATRESGYYCPAVVKATFDCTKEKLIGK